MEQELKKPTFSPEKKYEWKPEDTFSLTGQEFAYLYNTLAAEENELVMKLERLNLLKKKLVEAVESGVAKEVTEDKKEDGEAEVVEATEVKE